MWNIFRSYSHSHFLRFWDDSHLIQLIPIVKTTWDFHNGSQSAEIETWFNSNSMLRVHHVSLSAPINLVHNSSSNSPNSLSQMNLQSCCLVAAASTLDDKLRYFICVKKLSHRENPSIKPKHEHNILYRQDSTFNNFLPRMRMCQDS